MYCGACVNYKMLFKRIAGMCVCVCVSCGAYVNPKMLFEQIAVRVCVFVCVLFTFAAKVCVFINAHTHTPMTIVYRHTIAVILIHAHTYMAIGYGLGGSAIAMFGRVGGGIFTKAADGVYTHVYVYNMCVNRSMCMRARM